MEEELSGEQARSRGQTPRYREPTGQARSRHQTRQGTYTIDEELPREQTRSRGQTPRYQERFSQASSRGQTPHALESIEEVLPSLTRNRRQTTSNDSYSMQRIRGQYQNAP